MDNAQIAVSDTSVYSEHRAIVSGVALSNVKGSVIKAGGDGSCCSFLAW